MAKTIFGATIEKLAKQRPKQKKYIEQESTMNILFRIEKHSMNIFNKFMQHVCIKYVHIYIH